MDPDNFITLQGTGQILIINKSEIDKIIEVLYSLCIDYKIKCDLTRINNG